MITCVFQSKESAGKETRASVLPISLMGCGYCFSRGRRRVGAGEGEEGKGLQAFCSGNGSCKSMLLFNTDKREGERN